MCDFVSDFDQKPLSSAMQRAIELLYEDPVKNHAEYAKLEEWKADPDTTAVLQAVLDELKEVGGKLWEWWHAHHSELAARPRLLALNIRRPANSGLFTVS